jgi:hypothetical protein
MEGIKEALAKIKNGLVTGTLKTEKSNIQCWTCMDSGVVAYTKRINGYDYEYLAYCPCPKGDAYHFDGNNSERHPAPYRYPCISELFDPIEIADNNRKKYQGSVA